MMLPVCPVIETERLTLRGPSLDDFAPLAAFYADPVRSTGFGGPIPHDQAWRWFALNIGHWCLHGYGFWTAVDRAGAIVGIVGLWNPEGWPEPELGWVLFEGHEGKGYATEAARAVLRFARVLGHHHLVAGHFIDNPASGAVLRKVGFKPTGAVRQRYSLARGYETQSVEHRIDLGRPSDCDGGGDTDLAGAMRAA